MSLLAFHDILLKREHAADTRNVHLNAQVNYFPSRFDPVRHAERYPYVATHVSGQREKRIIEKENNFQQPGDRFRSFDPARRERFIGRIAGMLSDPRCTQVGLDSLRVSWVAPTPPPQRALHRPHRWHAVRPALHPGRTGFHEGFLGSPQHPPAASASSAASPACCPTRAAPRWACSPLCQKMFMKGL